MTTIFLAEELATKVTAIIYEREPGLLERFGEKGKTKCYEDNLHHLNHLKTAFDLQDIAVFTDYTKWLNGILIKHGMESKHLIDNFAIIRDVLKDYKDSDSKRLDFYQTALKAGINSIA
ncbi:hypothetical protein AM500_16660 [Bacillus sp. FJAT-18017]|uniref:hypothetical protein n=1 Tax=Bacillus sp. FJAT-18017 TaxID=1705566 RepID=UPI0006AEBA3E|nr:hypothetical protein [Bacillus sp. FJAT-18017]ALC91243.1 hypothetical protein AM500_16660 [Bacillus sp. FJAT-18017]